MENSYPRVFALPKDKPLCATFMYDDTYIAVGTENGRILILPLIQNQPLKKLLGHKKSITCMDVYHSANLLVTGSEDTTVAVWKGKESTIIRPNDGIIKFVSVAQAKPLVLIAGEDGCPSVWNIETAEAVLLMKQFPSRVTAVAMAPNGKIFAVSTEENGCQLFDSTTGRPVVQIQTPEIVSSIGFSDKSGFIALGCIDGQITVYDYKHHTVVSEKEVHYSTINAIALHGEENVLVSSSKEGLHVSDPTQLIPRFSVDGEDRIFQMLCFSENGDFYVSAATDKKIYLFLTPTDEEMNPPQESDDEVQEETPNVEVSTPQVSYSTTSYINSQQEEEEHNETPSSDEISSNNVKLLKMVIQKMFDLQGVLDKMMDRISVIDQQIARITNIQNQRKE